MENSSRRIAAAWFLFVLGTFLSQSGWATELLAADENVPGQTLTGLGGIAVMVMPVNPDAERTGLKREQIQTNVEQKLQKAGIKMLTERELRKPGFPYLNIAVKTTKDTPALYSYGIKTEMYKQEIQNPQDEIDSAMQTINIKVWSMEQTGTVSDTDLNNTVQKKLDDSIEKFINAYLAANPKK